MNSGKMHQANRKSRQGIMYSGRMDEFMMQTCTSMLAMAGVR